MFRRSLLCGHSNLIIRIKVLGEHLVFDPMSRRLLDTMICGSSPRNLMTHLYSYETTILVFLMYFFLNKYISAFKGVAFSSCYHFKRRWTRNYSTKGLWMVSFSTRTS